jgi:dTDP-4-amino-4,6-dideoxygalactose transaminase
MGLGLGDKVIIPSFTIIASANTVQHTRATPVLVDSEMETWNMDVSKIEEKITKNTKAIMPVHTYGDPCDMEPIMVLAEKQVYSFWKTPQKHMALYIKKRLLVVSETLLVSVFMLIKSLPLAKVE